MNAPHSTRVALLLIVLLTNGVLAASWLDRLGLGKRSPSDLPAVSLGDLTQDQIVSGLKQALGQGVEHAVNTLGKPDGFFNDLNVRIPLPAGLKKVESSLRMLRQDKLADDFVATMNRAAEKAVPEAASVLSDSVRQMTLSDAQAILTGTNNAATQYFRRSSETNLFERFYPIVAKATEETGVTSAYKKMIGKVSFANAFLGQDTADLDSYITHKTLDGLFFKIAEEEKRIRQNPAARGTELLQKVFGAIRR